MTGAVCPLCGGIEFSSWRFGLLACTLCGGVVDKAIWRPGANEELNEVSFGGDAVGPAASMWLRVFESLNNRRTMKRVRKATGRGSGLLLEVGVGSGAFLALSRHSGFSPRGCDLSRAICRRVQMRIGVEMYCGTLESMSLNEHFDVLVMNHVVEHVSDPRALLGAAFQHLSPGGVLHLAVPNAAAWEAYLPGWSSYEPYHLVYFTPTTLRRVVEQAGFEVLEIGTHESFSGWFLAILRTLLRRNGRTMRVSRGPSTGERRRLPLIEHAYRSTMVVCGTITLPLRRLQAGMGKGDEVILLARKQANVCQ